MITVTRTIKTNGLEGVPVTVECEITKGIGIHLLGLADLSVKESLLRTVTALTSQGYSIPGQRIIINLAPADLNKTGTHYDLPIAIAFLSASEQKNLPDIDKWTIIGELGLDASVRAVEGAVQAVETAIEQDCKGVILPWSNISEWISLYEGTVPIYGVKTLEEAIRVIEADGKVETAFDLYELIEEEITPSESHWDSLRGYPSAYRAMEIAAAGNHNMLMIGAPGSGKTSYSKAIRDILPPITKDEAKKMAKIWSVSNFCNKLDIHQRPFRAPHISAAKATWLGGGIGESLRPGEITIANSGVLYIDELDQMPKSLSEAFRGPLEDKKITLSRLKSTVSFPAETLIVASATPCKCGYYGEGDRCTCTTRERTEHLSALHGNVIYGYLDIQLYVNSANTRKGIAPEPCSVVAKRVARAREIQAERFKGTRLSFNAEMNTEDINVFCKVSDECKDLLERLFSNLGLSVTNKNRIIRIARTIADLEESDIILTRHIAEASSFRFAERNYYLEEK